MKTDNKLKASPMKPTVFFDFDDTLVVTRHLVIEFLSLLYGVKFPTEGYFCGNSLDQIVNGLLPRDKTISREQFWENYNQLFLKPGKWYDRIFPVRDADLYIPRLAARYDLWVVTARQDESLPFLKLLCEKFFGQHIAGIHFVWKRYGAGDFRIIQSKREFMAGFPGEKIAFFDDNPGEIRQTQAVIPSYLFDPNGYHRDDRSVSRRVESWKEIADLLLK